MFRKRAYMEKAKTATERLGKVVPNPKSKLQDQVREVTLLKHYSFRPKEDRLGFSGFACDRGFEALALGLNSRASFSDELSSLAVCSTSRFLWLRVGASVSGASPVFQVRAFGPAQIT